MLYFSNEAVAGIVMSPAINRSSGATEEPLVETVVRFMDRKQPPEAQLEASRVLAYLYRTGLVSERDPVLVYKAMPCVVRLTKEEEDVETRVLAAETLAFLIELSPELQVGYHRSLYTWKSVAYVREEYFHKTSPVLSATL